MYHLRVRHTLSKVLLPLLVGAAIVSLTSAARGQDLNGYLSNLILTHKLSATDQNPIKLGVMIIDDSGTVLANLNEKEQFIPASNMKLVTSACALKILGSDFTFRTTFGLLGDDLVITGDGDPALADPVLLEELEPPMDTDDLLGGLVGAVKQAGVEELDEIIVDDRVFDREYVHPSWPLDQLNRWYCAEVSGLNVHKNVLWVFPAPASGSSGTVKYAIEPDSPWIEMDVRARRAERGGNAIALTRPKTVNRFRMTGKVATVMSKPVSVTLHNPPRYFGRLMANRLIAAGIVVDLQDRLAPGDLESAPAGIRLADADEDLMPDRVIAEITTPMDLILERCNTDSQNLFAEALIKRVGNAVTGEPGSWSNGAAVERMVLTQMLGPSEATRVVVADGSGMSRLNRVTPGVMVNLLLEMQGDSELSIAYLNSLATPGRGTLRKRFLSKKPENLVQAKSGYLDGVLCLSGYVTDEASGRRVMFSILCNEVPKTKNSNAKLFQESIVLLIDQWISQKAGAAAEAIGG